MSLIGFHPLLDEILSQNLPVVADQGCHLEGSSSYKGTAYKEYTVVLSSETDTAVSGIDPLAFRSFVTVVA
jgi:hypothetical protein